VLDDEAPAEPVAAEPAAAEPAAVDADEPAGEAQGDGEEADAASADGDEDDLLARLDDALATSSMLLDEEGAA